MISSVTAEYFTENGAPAAPLEVRKARMCDIAPILERSMIDHSYSCRVGMGTGAARERCRQLVKRNRYALKADVTPRPRVINPMTLSPGNGLQHPA